MFERRMASEDLVLELFARLDTGDLAGAAALYAPDGAFLGAKGPAAIEATMRRGMAANGDKRSRHVIGNLRTAVGDEEVVVTYTAVAYTLDGPGPHVVRSVYDQQQVHGYVDDVPRILRHVIPDLPGTE